MQKKTIIIFFILLIMSGKEVWCQLVPFRHNFKWGYKNLANGTTMPAIYDHVSEFDRNGFAVVSSDAGEQILDTNGNFQTPLIRKTLYTINQYLFAAYKDSLFAIYGYQSQQPLTDSILAYEKMKAQGSKELYLVRRTTGMGLLQESGDVIIPMIYKEIIVHDGNYFAKGRQKTYTYDSTGAILDSGNFQYYEPRSDGNFTMFLNEKKGILDQNKNVMVPPRWDEVRITDYPHLFVVWNYRDRPHLYSTRAQSCIDPFPFQSLISYPNGYIQLYNGKQYGLINAWGTIILKDSFDYIKPWTDNTIVARKNDRYGVFDEQGKSLTGLKYQLIVPLTSYKVGLFVNEHGKHGLYHASGQKIIPCKYSNIDRSGNIFRAKEGDVTMHYTIDPNGNVLSSKRIKNLHVLKIDKFKMHEAFEKLDMEVRMERLKNYDPMRIQSDSLNLHLALIGSESKGYKLHDYKKNKSLTDPFLKYFDLQQFLKYNVAMVGIHSKKRNYALLSRKGNFVTSVEYKGKGYRIDDLEPFNEDYIVFISSTTKCRGLLSREGKVILPPLYTTIKRVYQGQVIALLAGKGWGVLSLSGEVIVPFEYTQVEYDNPDNPSYIVVSEFVGKYGYVDSLGHERTLPQYNHARNFSEGHAAVKTDQGWTFIDSTGAEICAPVYQKVQDFSNGLAAVRHHNVWGYVNPAGEEIIAPQYINALDFGNGLAPVKLDHNYGYINRNNEPIIPFRYKTAGSFRDGYAIVKKGKKYGIVDTTGNMVVPARYSAISELDGGYDLKRGRKKHFLANDICLLYKKEAFRSIKSLGNGLFAVKKKKFYRVLRADGVYKVDQKLFVVRPFLKQFCWVKTTAGWGIIDTSGAFALKDTFSHIKDFNPEGIAYGKSGSNHYSIRLENGNLYLDPVEMPYVIPNTYLGTSGNQKLYLFHRTRLNRGPYGIRNQEGKELLPDYYSNITPLRNGFCIVRKEDMKGIYQLDGTVTCKPIYEAVQKLNERDIYMVRTGGKIGYVDARGNWLIPLGN